ncbi:hypothetical protein [Brevundimonas sp. R86498]
MDNETDELVRRWIVRFCEMPILIDPDLMRAVLNDLDPKPEENR